MDIYHHIIPKDRTGTRGRKQHEPRASQVVDGHLLISSVKKTLWRLQVAYIWQPLNLIYHSLIFALEPRLELIPGHNLADQMIEECQRVERSQLDTGVISDIVPTRCNLSIVGCEPIIVDVAAFDVRTVVGVVDVEVEVAELESRTVIILLAGVCGLREGLVCFAEQPSLTAYAQPEVLSRLNLVTLYQTIRVQT